jgi:hypothetical protein
MRIFLAAIFLVFTLSCKEENDPPGDLIPSKKMETIIWQLIEADQYVINIIAKDSTKNLAAERVKLYSKVFELNSTNRAVFNNSYKYYMGRPDISKIMFDSIAVRASRQRNDAYRPKPMEKPSPKKLPVN